VSYTTKYAIEKIHAAVEEAIASGMSVADVRREMSVSWEQVLREKLAADQKEWSK